mgnify:CR=1 FL=1|jgi:hypothetical protein
MKLSKLKVVLISSIVATSIFVACTVNKDDKSSEALSSVEFNKIGENHNNALDFIDSKYQASRLSSRTTISEDEQIQFIIDKTVEYLRGKTFTVNNIVVDEFPMPSINEFKEFYADLETKDLGDFEDFKSIKASIEDIERIERNYEDGTEFINYQNLATGATFKSSIAYWISKNKTDENSRRINWYSIALSDASGAYGGAQWGALGGPASAVGGAISMGILSSAYSGFIGSLW